MSATSIDCETDALPAFDPLDAAPELGDASRSGEGEEDKGDEEDFIDESRAETKGAVGLQNEVLTAILFQITDWPAWIKSVPLVSRFWNACAARIIYSHIELDWDSRCGRHLVRSLHANPALLPLIRSITVSSYYRLQYWIEAQNFEANPLKTEHTKLCQPWIARLPEDEQEAARDEEYPEPDSRFYEEARALAVPQWLEMSRKHGAVEWNDEGPEGDGPRREGMVVLLRLAGGCPNLRKLELSPLFDFESLEGKTVEALLSPSLSFDSIVELDPCRDSTVERVLVSRPPILEILKLPLRPTGPNPFALLSLPQPHLPKLHHLRISLLAHTPLPALHAFLTLHSPTLRTLDLFIETSLEPSVPVALEPLVPPIIALLPHLSTLNLRFFPNPAPPTPSLLTFLSTSTTIRHLDLPMPPTPLIIASLPPSLLSLAANVGRTYIQRAVGRAHVQPVTGPRISIVDTLDRLVDFRKHSGVTKVTLWNIEEDERALATRVVEEAREAGLEVVFRNPGRA